VPCRFICHPSAQLLVYEASNRVNLRVIGHFRTDTSYTGQAFHAQPV